MRKLLIVTLILAAAAAQITAQEQRSQQQDDEFARLVKEWTTRPEFMSPLVDHLPKSPDVPSPKDVLGYHIGMPGKLTYYEDILRYYQTLAQKTPRLKIFTAGKTDEGRDLAIVMISSEPTIANLEQYRSYLNQLADPRKITDAEARNVIAAAKPIYHLMGGLHSSETGPSEMLMELAYRLAVEDSPEIRQIRDNVIVAITAVADPDGRDRYVDWYYLHKTNETEEENFGGSPYWGKYIFHDNNRDINYSQVTMRSQLDWYLQWHPPIMHDLHESQPFLYTFSGQPPQNPTIDPIVYGELPWFANFEMSQLTKYGMPGVWTFAFVDMWSPGYLGFMSSNHNGLLRMYETFGNGGANTIRRRIQQNTAREWYRPLPPYQDVEWSMRNNTNFMQTGVLTALQLTSQFPKVVLENFYQKSRNSIESGKKDAPFGYVIPAGQRDMTRVALAVNLLRTQGIEVGQSKSEVKLREGVFPPGSYIVKRDQPYGRLAKILLEKQNFPDPNLRTYDDSGWTLGLATHTDIKEISDKAILDVAVSDVVKADLRGSVKGGQATAAYAIANTGSNNIVTLRYRLKNYRVLATEKSFVSGDTQLPPGSLIVSTGQLDDAAHQQVRSAVEQLGLTAVTLTALPSVATHEIDLPRLAIYSTWGSTQNVGWVRHAFDHFGIPFELIHKERVLRGSLRNAYDVIVVPSQGSTAKSIVFDVAKRSKPLAYKKSDKFKFLGAYGESDDITGGMGIQGVAELEKFVNDGGVLVTLGTASLVPAEFGITPAIDVSRPSAQFYAPGPFVEAEVLRADHPIFYGYAATMLPVRWAGGPLLQVPERDRSRQVLMRFPGGDKSVLSGLMRGANEIQNRPAIADVPQGKGRVLMFATNPCYRWQNHGEFNMLFNAVLHYNDFQEGN
jgi:hypothetical protein